MPFLDSYIPLSPGHYYGFTSTESIKNLFRGKPGKYQIVMQYNGPLTSYAMPQIPGCVWTRKSGTIKSKPLNLNILVLLQSI